MSTLLGNEIQFQGITNAGKEGIDKDRGEANSKWCITVSFSSELSAWSHVILRRVWISRQNHWIPSWRGRACSWFADFSYQDLLSISVPCDINFPALTACHLSPLGNHCEKAEFHGSHSWSAATETSTTKGSMHLDTTGSVRGNDLGECAELLRRLQSWAQKMSLIQ